MQFKFKIWDKIKEVWPLYKLHFGTFVLLMLISGVVQVIGGSKEHVILSILSSIVSLIVFYVWVRFVLSLIDKKEYNPFSVKALPTLGQFWNLLKTAFLNGLCVLGGFILLVIPGFYISGRLMFSLYLSIEKNQGARVTIKEAWKMTEGYGWLLFWKAFVIGLFMALGFVALLVGSFVTYPIGIVVLLMMYREFSNMKSGIVKDISPVVAPENKSEATV
jgi:membrane-anchored glycerophosphoryl diester phosphodiesterase (GDPDase)